MAMTRRTFVTATGLAALGAVVGRALGRVDVATAAVAPALRPAPSGSSSTRCAQCGSLAHTALDGACARAAKSRREVQASARTLATRARRPAGPDAGRAGS
jgi:hypothetical protein